MPKSWRSLLEDEELWHFHTESNVLKFKLQIHKEAEREKTQSQLLNQMTSVRTRDDNSRGSAGPGSNDRKKSGRPSNQASEDGWQSVTSKTSQRVAPFDRIDTMKISNLAQNSARRVRIFIWIGF